MHCYQWMSHFKKWQLGEKRFSSCQTPLDAQSLSLCNQYRSDGRCCVHEVFDLSHYHENFTWDQSAHRKLLTVTVLFTSEVVQPEVMPVVLRFGHTIGFYCITDGPGSRSRYIFFFATHPEGT